MDCPGNGREDRQEPEFRLVIPRKKIEETREGRKAALQFSSTGFPCLPSARFPRYNRWHTNEPFCETEIVLRFYLFATFTRLSNRPLLAARGSACLSASKRPQKVRRRRHRRRSPYAFPTAVASAGADVVVVVVLYWAYAVSTARRLTKHRSCSRKL